MTTALELLQSVQYVTVKGKRFAVIDSEDWEALLEWLEDIEDAQIARDAIQSLRAAQGDRKRAGWLKWDDIQEELE